MRTRGESIPRQSLSVNLGAIRAASPANCPSNFAPCASAWRPRDTPRTLRRSSVISPRRRSRRRVAKPDLSFVICARSLLIRAVIARFAQSVNSTRASILSGTRSMKRANAIVATLQGGEKNGRARIRRRSRTYRIGLNSACMLSP